jgi:hypothetical protein
MRSTGATTSTSAMMYVRDDLGREKSKSFRMLAIQASACTPEFPDPFTAAIVQNISTLAWAEAHRRLLLVDSRA